MEKKYLVQGIIGCALFGVGDWLLGFVDPGKVEGDVFYFISAGHQDYADWKIVMTLVCAVIGVLFFWQGCVHISDYTKEEKDKAGASRVFTFSWLIIHFTVTIMVLNYSYMCKNVGTKQAALMSKTMDKLFDPFAGLAYIIVLIAFVDLIIVNARGRTILQKRAPEILEPRTEELFFGARAMGWF